METTHEKPNQFSSPGSATEKAAKAARAAGDQISDAAAEKLGQAKQMVGDVYDQVNKTVSEKYSQAVDFGRENPGKTTLIALGVGIGVGMLMMTNLRRPRRSRARVVEPIVNALSTLACELFA